MQTTRPTIEVAVVMRRERVLGRASRWQTWRWVLAEVVKDDAVGTALIKTLEQGLGPAFTPDVKDAWVSVYGVMTQVMTKQ